MKKKAFSRLVALGPDRVAIINNMLAQGKSSTTVARVIQGEWNEFSDVAEKTFVQQLNRYRVANIVQLPAHATLEEVSAAPAYARLNVLAHAIELTMTQRERVLDLVATEKKAGKRNADVSKEMELYGMQLKDVQKLQFDLGIDDLKNQTAAYRGVGTQVQTPGGDIITVQVTEQVGKAEEIFRARGLALPAPTIQQ